MAGRVALVANEKGGVGKSVFTRTLIDWLRVEKHEVAAFDADGTIGATVRILVSRWKGAHQNQDRRLGSGATTAELTRKNICSTPSSRTSALRA